MVAGPEFAKRTAEFMRLVSLHKEVLNKKATLFEWQMVAGAGFEPTTSGLWARRATRLLYPAIFINLSKPYRQLHYVTLNIKNQVFANCNISAVFQPAWKVFPIFFVTFVNNYFQKKTIFSLEIFFIYTREKILFRGRKNGIRKLRIGN